MQFLIQPCYLFYQPEVTIIITLFNKENYIERAIKSVLQQKYDKIKILIIDDGSTDMSKHMAQHYVNMHSNVRMIHLNRNYGTLFARAKGIFHTTSEFLLFLDADDEITDNIVFDAIQLFTQQDIDFIMFNVNIRSKGSYGIYKDYSPELRYQNNIYKGGQLYDKLLFESTKFFTFCGKVFKKDKLLQAISQLNYILMNKIIISEDLIILTKYLQLEPILQTINKLGYIVNENEQSITYYMNRLEIPQKLNRIHQDYFIKEMNQKYFDLLQKEYRSQKSLCQLIFWNQEPVFNDDCIKYAKVIQKYLKSQCKCNQFQQFVEFYKQNQETIMQCYENNTNFDIVSGNWQYYQTIEQDVDLSDIMDIDRWDILQQQYLQYWIQNQENVIQIESIKTFTSVNIGSVHVIVFPDDFFPGDIINYKEEKEEVAFQITIKLNKILADIYKQIGNSSDIYMYVENNNYKYINVNKLIKEYIMIQNLNWRILKIHEYINYLLGMIPQQSKIEVLCFNTEENCKITEMFIKLYKQFTSQNTIKM